MATQNTTKFADIALLFGDGATPTEGFDAICGITDIDWTTGTSEESEDLPDCDDPDAPSYESPTVTAVSDTVQIQGFVDADHEDVFDEWVRTGVQKNIRIVDTKEGKRSTGPAIVTNRNRQWTRRKSGRFNITLKFTSPPVKTAIS